jgi:hypothetical protein
MNVALTGGKTAEILEPICGTPETLETIGDRDIVHLPAMVPGESSSRNQRDRPLLLF